MKNCKICNKIKLLKEFGKSEGRYRNNCLSCANINAKHHYLLNREEIIKKRKIRDKNRKLCVFDYYSNNKRNCACCNESILEFLSLDHVNNDGYKHRKTVGNGQKLYRWIINNNYPEGFQVLCMNCNFAKGQFKICPHNR